jgi:protein SCO1
VTTPARPRRAFLAAFILLALACKKQEPLPHLGHVPEFSLVDQDGQAFGARQLLGQPHLVSFMFARCPSICPAVTNKKKAILELARARGKRLALVSISIDGDNDTPPVLRAYMAKYGLDPSTWSFLTGDAAKVAAHAEWPPTPSSPSRSPSAASPMRARPTSA